MVLALLLSIMMVAGAAWYWQSLQKQATEKQSRLPLAPTKAINSANRSSIKKTAVNKAITNKPGGKDDRQTYRAVSIQCKDGACTAAQEMLGKRFLTGAAPTIPLATCDAAHCQCSYTHHSDRRINDDDDRRSMHGLQTELYPQTTGNERRNKRTRRKSRVR